MKRPPILVFLAALCAGAFAQTVDAPPVDAKQLLQALRQFREQNETSTKTRMATAYQQVTAAAGSNEKAAAAWADAVLAVQFAGVDHQTTAVRDWQQSEGLALRSKEAANAARLHLQWLGMTIQHASGVETKQMLNNIVDFTKQVQADSDLIEKVADQIEKARERMPGGKRPPANKALVDDARTKKLHDSIMRTSVVSGPVAKKLQIVELLGDIGGRKKKEDAGEGAGWEAVPGNVDGIYRSIILPEFRASKDPRLLEYWDMVLKRDAESVQSDMPDYDVRQATQVRRPTLLWARAQDVLLLGQKNRAVTEMFNIVKTYPQHPEAAGWMAKLESILAPSAAPVPAPASGAPVVAPPSAVPTATVLPGPGAGAPPAGQPAPR
jgi:hypothetical protein